jgi:nicotinamidase-related amidase
LKAERADLESAYRIQYASASKDLAAPQGFEPRYADPESAVLPLNEGAAHVALQQGKISASIIWMGGALVNKAHADSEADPFSVLRAPIFIRLHARLEPALKASTENTRIGVTITLKLRRRPMVTAGGIQIEDDYFEIARRPLEAEQCALIVVDIQEKLLPPIWQKEQFIRNSQLLIRLAGILKMPALVTTQYAKGLGNIVPEIASLMPESRSIDKVMFSCFGSDVFCSLLKRLPGQRTTILLCGMETHICVMQTALAGLREGYLVHVASDAVSSRTESNWRIGLDRMRAAGAVISSAEMMIYELLRSSGAPAFKELLPYLKG